MQLSRPLNNKWSSFYYILVFRYTLSALAPVYSCMRGVQRKYVRTVFYLSLAPVAQWIRARPCGGRGLGFESSQAHNEWNEAGACSKARLGFTWGFEKRRYIVRSKATQRYRARAGASQYFDFWVSRMKNIEESWRQPSQAHSIRAPEIIRTLVSVLGGAGPTVVGPLKTVGFPSQKGGSEVMFMWNSPQAHTVIRWSSLT